MAACTAKMVLLVMALTAAKLTAGLDSATAASAGSRTVARASSHHSRSQPRMAPTGLQKWRAPTQPASQLLQPSATNRRLLQQRRSTPRSSRSSSSSRVPFPVPGLNTLLGGLTAAAKGSIFNLGQAGGSGVTTQPPASRRRPQPPLPVQVTSLASPAPGSTPLGPVRLTSLASPTLGTPPPMPVRVTFLASPTPVPLPPEPVSSPPPAPPAGQALFTAPGLWRFTPPPGVRAVSVVCVGAGGASGSPAGGSSSGGGGGALAWANGVPVTPGSPVNVTIGRSSDRDPKQTNSWFGSPSLLLAGGGGLGNTMFGGAGGKFTVNKALLPSSGGGEGGAGGATGNSAGAGGGAGGYSGPGGAGEGPGAATAGKGGGGGGGGSNAFGTMSASGGGVGLLGAGAAGEAGPLANGDNGQGGGGGSNGTAGSDGACSTGSVCGGVHGGGAGSALFSQTGAVFGGGGACRVMWGAGRSFPDIGGDV